MNHLELLDSHKKLNEIQYFYMTQRCPRTGRQSIGLSARMWDHTWLSCTKLSHFFAFPYVPLLQHQNLPETDSVQSGWHEGLIETGPFWVFAVMQIIINMMNKATNMNSKLMWVMVQSCIYALTLLHIHRTWCAHLCECLFPPLPWGGNSINQRSWNTWRCKYQELWDVEFVPKTAVLFNTQT